MGFFSPAPATQTMRDAASERQAAAAAGPSSNGRSFWACEACTFVNDNGVIACEACDTPRLGAASTAAVPAAAAPPRQRAPRLPPPPMFSETDTYTLDCGCCVPFKDASAAALAACKAAPTSLAAALRHFSCPNAPTCANDLTHRDLEALVGHKLAAKVDRHFYNLSCNAASGSSSSSLEGSQCVELASAIAELHAAVVSTTAGSGAGERGSAIANNTRNQGKGKGCGKGHGRWQQSAGPAGVGYGGGNRDDAQVRQQSEVAAAQRQRSDDAATTATLARLRSALAFMQSSNGPNGGGSAAGGTPAGGAHLRVGWLPLSVLCVLSGSPLAACLRTLLSNDSLMDVVSRREVYSEALQLVGQLAGRAELVPLLLRPADGDVLASFVAKPNPTDAAAAPAAGREGSGGAAVGRSKKKRARQEEEAVELERKRSKAAAEEKNNSEEAEEEDKEEEEECPEAALERSLWKALQAFEVQCTLFLRTAQQLTTEGSEDDVDTVGTVLLVQETCAAVNEAVTAWQALADPPQTARQQRQQQEEEGGEGGGAVPSAAQRQRYADALKPLAFRMVDLVGGGDYYFRAQLNQGPQGDAAARLRRLSKEVSTLSRQLPVDWDSSILVVVDSDRMDALRAVIFPPEDSPYASGVFVFDILLPADYPNRPPSVQFMTTGGGKVRFNPNLYDSGKVCLSLLGTWSGPSWNPASSSLLQVLVSLQAMILGEKNPYGNEPGYEAKLHTAAGKASSARYNREQRFNTVKYSMEPALRRPPRGFEAAVKLHFTLKAAAIKEQLREWTRQAAAEEAAEKQGGGGGSANRCSQATGRAYGKDGMKGAMASVVAAIDDLTKGRG